MIQLLIVILIALLILNGWQFFSRRKLKRELDEIHHSLAHIVENGTSQKLLLQTDQQIVQRFLVQINRLLDYNQKVMADYARTKLNLKKMLSNMSHDLKTPLTVVLGYVEKLQLDEKMTLREREETISRLHQKMLSVISLLNQFFDLAKIDSDEYSIPLSKIEINELCRKNVLEFYDLLQSKGMEVEISIPERPYYILGNEEALHRILNNLISNAIRYGSDGKVLGLTLRQDEDNIAIDIWDKGKGISEANQDRVFERLYTLDDARNPEFQGSGLGLSITKRLTEAMKGSIHLESKPYEKTVFTCVFKRITY
ncbi:ATP-binding protein [Ornithinibacillus sp. 179-J 7C1 HS]|uniref:ATP-binding protein n=1 Tax=Ornithinibacillus sp. 179-J 7C1 HS TaxID=3142384 RepID=UPI00399FE17A